MNISLITILHASSFLTLRLLPKIAFIQLLGEVNPSPPAETIVPLSDSDAEYSLPCNDVKRKKEMSKLSKIIFNCSQWEFLYEAQIRIDGVNSIFDIPPVAYVEILDHSAAQQFEREFPVCTSD